MLKEVGKILGLFALLIAIAIFSSISLNTQKTQAFENSPQIGVTK